MENNQHHLQSLNNSNYQIPSPKQNVIGWEVKSESGTYLGKVLDLLYDTQAMTVRYLVVDLTDNGMNLDAKKVMIPVGIASLHPNDDEIICPNLHIDQFSALPNYTTVAEVTTETEQEIRKVIGSPAALRLEETIATFDQQQFYAHHHFNEQQFYSRNKNQDTDRAEQQQTVNQLIENSIEHDLHAAASTTGIHTHHNEGKKIDEQHNN